MHTVRSGRHAFLVMAHDNWDILKVLLRLLDDERNHIYLHIDIKARPPKEITNYRPESSRLTFIPRQSIRWADYSLVSVTLDLLKAATRDGHHDYYHLLSGVDLPLKVGDSFHDFFESTDVEYVGVVPNQVWYCVRRLRFYHPFVKLARYRKSKTLKVLDRLFEYIQRLVGVNRLRAHPAWLIYDGWQWFSITDLLARHVVAQEDEIANAFNWAVAPDELFMQTIVMNSSFKDRLYDIHDLRHGSLRQIDWERGSPHTYGLADLDELKQSPALFARKFAEGDAFEVVKQLEEHLLSDQRPD